MESVLPEFPVLLWVASLCIAFAAGVVKGIVGFAFPLVFISGLGTVLAPEVALAGLILPTVFTNIQQAARHGFAKAVRATGQFPGFLLAGGLFLAIGAQVVPFVPGQTHVLVLGTLIVGFVLVQMLGWAPTHMVRSLRVDLGFGAVAGVFGGIAGVWGAPTVAYLTALNTPKAKQIQVQGVIYLAGALMLLVAHLFSGILTRDTLVFSALMVPPAMLGMVLGAMVQDRIDQTAFRRATQLSLLVAGLNLVRRGVFL